MDGGLDSRLRGNDGRVDPPLAEPITEDCRHLKPWRAKEVLHKLAEGRNPLEVKDRVIVGSNEVHHRMVEELSRTGRPAVVVAGKRDGQRRADRQLSDPDKRDFFQHALTDEKQEINFKGLNILRG